MSRPADNFRSPLGLALFFGTAILGLGVDLLTKSLAVANLKWQPEVELIPNWLHFTYTENGGAVFGIGQGQRPLFLVVSIGAIGFLIYLYSMSAHRRFQQVLLGMLMAGVVGNMYDRVRLGYVRDMIHALPRIYWPTSIASRLPPELARSGVFPWIFNVADMLLCVGVFLIVVYSAFQKPPAQNQISDSQEPTPQRPEPSQRP